MKPYRFKILFIFFIFPFIALSQRGNAEIALYNIGLGGIGAGIGAVINKKPNEKMGNVFLKGLWRGGLGGGLIFGSKKIIGEITVKDQLEYSWPAKVVDAAGVSIIEDAANNRPFASNWHINIGFNRLELETKDSFKFHYKILPISLGLTLIAASTAKPEWETMLRTGEIIFSAGFDRLPNNLGVASGNIIILRNDAIDNLGVISHEIIHIYQYYDYNFTTAYFKKPIQKWSDKSKTFNKLNNWVHWDLQAPILRGLYLLEEIDASDKKFNNFFEFEAEFFASPQNPRLLDAN